METNTQPTQDPLLVWTGRKEVHHERKRTWYIGTGFVLLALLFFIIATQAWSFLFVFAISVSLYFFVHHKPLPIVTAGILEHGIQIGTELYEWTDCKFFWVLFSNNHAELHIRRLHTWQPDLYITLDTVNPKAVQTLVSSFIPYHEGKNERFLDILTRILKI